MIMAYKYGGRPVCGLRTAESRHGTTAKRSLCGSARRTLWHVALPVLGTQCCSDAFFSSEGCESAGSRGSCALKSIGTVYRWRFGERKPDETRIYRMEYGECVRFRRKKAVRSNLFAPPYLMLRTGYLYGTIEKRKIRATKDRATSVRLANGGMIRPADAKRLSMVRCLSGSRRQVSAFRRWMAAKSCTEARNKFPK